MCIPNLFSFYEPNILAGHSEVQLVVRKPLIGDKCYNQNFPFVMKLMTCQSGSSYPTVAGLWPNFFSLSATHLNQRSFMLLPRSQIVDLWLVVQLLHEPPVRLGSSDTVSLGPETIEHKKNWCQNREKCIAWMVKSCIPWHQEVSLIESEYGHFLLFLVLRTTNNTDTKCKLASWLCLMFVSYLYT